MFGVAQLIRRGLARGYYRLVRHNYDHRLFARKNQTAAGVFTTYELAPRHRTDPMLAAMDADCAPDAVVYDVGANAGAYALGVTAEQPARRVLAVEPSPPAVAKLRANRRASGLEDRVWIEPTGLGTDTGARRFYESSLPELSAFGRASATRFGATVVATHEVPVCRLDDLVADYPPPDAIKIDVEGAGAAVLQGATSTLTTHGPTLFIEVHESFPDTVATMRTVLDDAGYRIEDGDGYWRCVPQR